MQSGRWRLFADLEAPFGSIYFSGGATPHTHTPLVPNFHGRPSEIPRARTAVGCRSLTLETCLMLSHKDTLSTRKVATDGKPAPRFQASRAQRYFTMTHSCWCWLGCGCYHPPPRHLVVCYRLALATNSTPAPPSIAGGGPSVMCESRSRPKSTPWRRVTSYTTYREISRATMRCSLPGSAVDSSFTPQLRMIDGIEYPMDGSFLSVSNFTPPNLKVFENKSRSQR